MIEKTIERKRAIKLRKEGKTYSEILLSVPVAKSTLSLWLREVGLAKKQRQRISILKRVAQKRGAESRRSQRIQATNHIYNLAGKEIGRISDREKWLIGIILYWAEGSKQKEWNISQSLQFTNSDPLMISFYLKWLTECMKIRKKDIVLSLAIHENNKHRMKEVINFWETLTGRSPLFSDKVYFKRHKPGSYRHNKGENYYGTVRVYVLKSTNLNRKISGLVSSICHQCGVV